MKPTGANLKSALAAILSALVLVALVACDPEPEPTPSPTPTASPAPTATAAPATPAPTASPIPATTPAPVQPEPSPSPTPASEIAPVLEVGPPLPFDPTVVRGTLSNGLSYYIKQNGEPRERAQFLLVVRGGSVHEDEDQRGLAHFVEHMAFNGTERFVKQEIVEYLESVGGTFGPDINAGTSFDNTLYWVQIPTDDPKITETAFQILSDWAFAIAFEPEGVELERGVVLEEWRLSQGFSSRIQDNLLTLLFGSSRYAQRAPIGLTSVIETAPVQRLRDYYERWYRPDQMAIIAVGDFDPAVIKEKIEQHFAPPPEGQASQDRAAVGDPTDRPQIAVPTHDIPQIEVFSDPESPGTQFILIRKLRPDNGQGLAFFKRNVVEQLAFMMLNARLFERAQVGDPPYLQANAGRSPYVESLDIATFSGWVEQDGVERGLEAVLEEMHRIRLHGFTDTELAREKITLLRAVESAYTQRDQIPSASLADEYTVHFLSGIPAPGIAAEWELYQELLPQIDLADFGALKETWTQLEDTALLVVRPATEGSITDGELATTLLKQIQAGSTLDLDPFVDSLDEVPLLANPPVPGSITKEEQLESIDAVRWTLSNGITVIAKQTDFRNDEVAFSSYSPGGHSLVDDDDHISAQYADAIVAGSGVGLHDSVALDKLLAGKRVSAFPYIGELFEGFAGGASPQDLETLFQLITLYATEPRLDPAYFSRYEARLQSVAETRAADPDSVLFDRVGTVLSQSHHRERPLTVETLAELDADRVEAIYAGRFRNLGDSTFVFVGAFDWDYLRSLTETYLASLPSTGDVEQWRDVGIDPPTGLEDYVVRSGIEPRAATVLVFAGEAEFSQQEALALSVAGEMLGIRLRERVREDLGGTYSIQVNASRSRLPDPEYQVSIVFGSDPSRTDELLSVVLEEIAWLRGGGEMEYLDTVKEQFLSSHEEQLRENGYWLREILYASQREEPVSQIAEFEERLEAVTISAIEAVALRVLPVDVYVRVVLLPVEE